MFSKITKLTWLIRLFGFSKVAMIYYCRPKVIAVDSDSLEIKIPLNRRTKNHINSMYFGALSVGADITGGFQKLQGWHVFRPGNQIGGHCNGNQKWKIGCCQDSW